MKLPKYVREKPDFFRFTPILREYTANSIYPWIFLPTDIYKNLKSSQPDLHHIAILIHEQEHHKRQKKMGWFVFGVKYLFSPKFRFTEELIAVKKAMGFLKKNNIPFNFNRTAKVLSIYLYLWPVSKHYAEKELRKIWDDIK